MIKAISVESGVHFEWCRWDGPISVIIDLPNLGLLTKIRILLVGIRLEVHCFTDLCNRKTEVVFTPDKPLPVLQNTRKEWVVEIPLPDSQGHYQIVFPNGERDDVNIKKEYPLGIF